MDNPKRLERPVVLLVNLGTPDSPAPADVRPFLRKFLGDPRIIEMPRAVWKPILEGIILRTRPKESGKLYESIWDLGEVQGSPLTYWSEQQRKAIADRLGDAAHVALAMRYSDPEVPAALDSLMDQGFHRVLVVPIYPQYSATTVAPIIDEVAHWLLKRRDQPEVRTLRSFPAAPAYISALAQALRCYWAEHGEPNFEAGDKLLLSFHSIPEAMSKAGDPYKEECELTAELLRAELGLEQASAVTTYQSVFGPAKWIGPATIDTVQQLAEAGSRRVDVICPGFTSDCLETLQEIDMLNRETFMEAGGKEFHYIPWANAAEPWLDALEEQVRLRLAGWL